ncbi:MAG: hypothetical protein R3C51_01135 [Parvularculaceae bacterium]
MILRRVIDHVKAQAWTAVFLDFVIVVAGVFIGIQVSNWNDERAAYGRREQVKATLLTDLHDASAVTHDGIYLPVLQGLADWRAAFDRGERPPPYFFRIEGSDTPPETWNTLQQESLAELFDPVSLFDLGFYYSEQRGIARKYIRYAVFVENEILPRLKQDASVFYTDDGSALKPEYAASMDRVLEFAEESEVMRRWARCLIFRIEAARSFETLCRRSNYRLDGMPAPEGRAS